MGSGAGSKVTYKKIWYFLLCLNNVQEIINHVVMARKRAWSFCKLQSKWCLQLIWIAKNSHVKVHVSYYDHYHGPAIVTSGKVVNKATPLVACIFYPLTCVFWRCCPSIPKSLQWTGSYVINTKMDWKLEPLVFSHCPERELIGIVIPRDSGRWNKLNSSGRTDASPYRRALVTRNGRPMLSWWLQMTWRQIGARSSATAMLSWLRLW